MGQGLGTTVLWSRRGISKRKIADRMRKMRVGTLKTQVGQGGGLPRGWPVWHVVAHLSHALKALGEFARCITNK